MVWREKISSSYLRPETKNLKGFAPGTKKNMLSAELSVQKIPSQIMSQLLYQAAMGQQTDIDLTKYTAGQIQTNSEIDKRGKSIEYTYINGMGVDTAYIVDGNTVNVGGVVGSFLGKK